MIENYDVEVSFKQNGEIRSRSWRKDGVLHRLDGPACEYSFGNDSYWINGVRYLEDESWKIEVERLILKNKVSELVSDTNFSEELLNVANENIEISSCRKEGELKEI